MHVSRDSLALRLALAYGLLILYASLYPLVTWQDHGADWFAFLSEPWPRYFTVLDIVLNVLAYLPLGFLLSAGALRRCAPWGAVLLATLLAAGLSVGVEVLQHYLPSRVPSNVDCVTNSLGGLLGALAGARWGWSLHEGGAVHRWRTHYFYHGTLADYGLLLALLWWLTQLSPEILLFGTGNVRRLLGLPPALDFTVERFLLLEACIAASGVMGVGLLLRRVLRLPNPLPIFIFLLVALGIRSGAAVVLMRPDDILGWATSGARAGLLAGVLVLAVVCFLPHALQQALGALSLFMTAVLVNLAPENPYLVQSLSVWRQGHFLNFNGLTRLVASLWPFLALLFLVLAGPKPPPPGQALAKPPI